MKTEGANINDRSLTHYISKPEEISESKQITEALRMVGDNYNLNSEADNHDSCLIQTPAAQM